jgi:hypothetical protein
VSVACDLNHDDVIQRESKKSVPHKKDGTVEPPWFSSSMLVGHCFFNIQNIRDGSIERKPPAFILV